MQGNPMLEMLNKSRPLSNNNLMNMVSAFKNSPNPQAMLNNMLMQNPRVTELINQYGGDPKTAFYALAQQRGINPDEILTMLKR